MKPLCLAGFLLGSSVYFRMSRDWRNCQITYPARRSAVDSKGSPLTISVSPFDDRRQSSEHLGMRARGGGGQTYFDVMDGTLSQRVTSSFVDFLNQAGLSALPANGAGPADVSIEPTIQKFTVRATDRPLSVFLEVDAVMAFTVITQPTKVPSGSLSGLAERIMKCSSLKRILKNLSEKCSRRASRNFWKKSKFEDRCSSFAFLRNPPEIGPALNRVELGFLTHTKPTIAMLGHKFI